MEKVVEYNSDSNGSVIELQLDTEQRIAIQSSNRFARVIDVKFPVETPIARRMGRWLIECKNQSVFMRECIEFDKSDCIIFSFEQKTIDGKIRFKREKRNVANEIEIKNIKRIDVYPKEVKQIKITTEEQQSATNSTNSENIVGMRQMKKELEEQRETSLHLREMLALRMEDIVSAIKASNETLRMTNPHTFLELKRLAKEEEQLKSEQTERNEELEKLTQSIQEINLDITNLQAKKENLQAQLKEKDAIKEVLEIDCEAVEIQINEIKEQVSLDSDTLRLLEDGCRLKHGTISNSIIEIEKEIEKIENKMGLILKFRSKFNEVVEDAILSGDGTISNNDE